MGRPREGERGIWSNRLDAKRRPLRFGTVGLKYQINPARNLEEFGVVPVGGSELVFFGGGILFCFVTVRTRERLDRQRRHEALVQMSARWRGRDSRPVMQQQSGLSALED